LVWPFEFDRLYGRWRSFAWPLEIVCMALGYRLYGRWRSFVWPLEIVCMAVDLQRPYKRSPTAIKTISNGHTNDLQRPYKRSPTNKQTISNSHSNNLKLPRKRSFTYIQTNLFREAFLRVLFLNPASSCIKSMTYQQVYHPLYIYLLMTP
jgi:hypothetical protein